MGGFFEHGHGTLQRFRGGPEIVSHPAQLASPLVLTVLLGNLGLIVEVAGQFFGAAAGCVGPVVGRLQYVQIGQHTGQLVQERHQVHLVQANVGNVGTDHQVADAVDAVG